jgi:hypothetical protein
MFKSKFLNKVGYGVEGDGMMEGSEGIAEQENQTNQEDSSMPEEHHETENAPQNVISDAQALSEFPELEKTNIVWPSRGRG